ncbi:TRAP transporter substrate-binding protein [Falsiroseomonas sp. HW251]|uniref:TRAP transporter substrate-binding protein n=1 Tax=Falsiroseomonas sp. HW251 TaxID=3390998 RepID=UPI003D3195D6
MRDPVKRRALLLAAAAGLTAPQVARAQATLNLRYANASNAQNISNVFAERMMKLVEERSGGRIRTQFLYNLGSEQTIVEGVSLGTIDMAISGYTGMPEFDALYFPFLLRDLRHGVRVMAGPIGERCRQAMQQRYNIRLVGVTNTGPFLLSTKTKIGSWADVRGRKIRVPPFAAYVEAIRAMGAAPTPVPFNEVYLALQQGVVDGLVTNLNVMIVNKFFEVSTNVASNEFGVGLDKFIISQRSYQRMTPEQRRIFDDTWAEVQPASVDYAIENAAKDFDAWRARNGADSVYALDLGELERILAPSARQFFEATFGPGSFDVVQRA